MEKLRPRFGSEFYYELAFKKLFTFQFSNLKAYTDNIHEFVYFFNFLYPEYVIRLTNAATDEERKELIKKPF